MHRWNWKLALGCMFIVSLVGCSDSSVVHRSGIDSGFDITQDSGVDAQSTADAGVDTAPDVSADTGADTGCVMDHCGTCDNDPSNDCVQDCNGVWGGLAKVDHCGTCDDDPSNDCAQDCNGDWGGTATTDQCGTCDNDPSNDCVKDCNGDWGGTATVDVCGNCTGGNTGESACPTVELSPVADATVDSAHPATNFGADQSLEVANERLGVPARVFLRFDLSSLPDNVAIRGVRLEAHAYKGYAFGGDGNVYTQFVADDSWAEDAITWDNAPSTDDTNLGYWNLWYDHTPSDKVGVNDDASLIPVVQREYNGDGMLSLRLHSPGYDTSYRSREYSDASQRPKLVVGYVPTTSATLEPTADAWVDSTAANYGTDTSLYIWRNSDRVIYLKFDLSSLPAGAQIITSTLSMTAYQGYAYGGDGNVYVHLVPNDTWTETNISGTNAPTPATDDLGHWFLWYDHAPRNQVGSLSSPAFRDAVETEFNGDQTISLRLNCSGYTTVYRSREYADASQRPNLTVQYIVP